VVSGDRLSPLAHLSRPPVANPLQQVGQARVGGGVGAQEKPRPVLTRLDLAALASQPPGLLHGLNRFDRDGPNLTVNTRPIQATLTEAAADRRASTRNAA